MNRPRPVNLNLFTIRFPVTAIVSILHRVSGVILLFCIPLLLWILQKSLQSESNFVELQQFFAKTGVKFVLWGLLAALFYHLLAGIRHLVMDFDIGVTKIAGKRSAYLVIIAAIILIIGTGYWLCYFLSPA